MIDFAKLYCDFHPHQIITNFCLNDTCMVGLCATCICTHTEHHANNKTTPEYQNIRATFSNMHDMIRKKITSLDNQKNRIEKITQFVHTKRNALKENIEQTRQQAIAAVNKFFDNKQKNMFRQVESQQKKMGLHSQARMESLMNSLNRETSLLITSAQELNSQNFLESYQRIKTQTLTNATKLEEEISRELDRNEDFETIINSNNEFFQGIFNVLQQSLQLTFTMNCRPLVPKVQQPHAKNYTNDSAIICKDKATSRFGSETYHNFSQPIYANRPHSSIDNFYSAVSFSHVPDMVKKETAQFHMTEHSEKQTTNSIPLDDTEKSIPQSGRKSKSFAKEVCQTQKLRDNTVQSQIFKEKDANQKQTHESLNNSMMNRNHQSQIFLVQKPYGNQSATGWNVQNRANPPVMKQSFIENLNQLTQEKVYSNSNSHVMIRNQSAMNLNHFQKPVAGQKINFVPQIYEPAYFNQSRTNENLNVSTDCKKVRKSGLSLMKASQQITSSRQKIHAER